MALTLLEASKINSGEIKRAAIIQMFAESTQLMRVMPYLDIPGGSYSYLVEGELPGVAFRGYNEGYESSAGVLNPKVESLSIAGGELDVDTMILKSRGTQERTLREKMKVKALGLSISDKFINGDSVANPREFDGLRTRINGEQLIPANLGATGADSPLSLEALDKAIASVMDPTHIIIPRELLRKFYKAARGLVGGHLSFGDKDAFGYSVNTYNGLPLIDAGSSYTGVDTMTYNEVGPAAGAATNASIYVVNLNDGYVTGLQNGTMEVKDLGEIDEKPVVRTRIDWAVGMAVMHGRAASRIWGITDEDITT